MVLLAVALPSLLSAVSPPPMTTTVIVIPANPAMMMPPPPPSATVVMIISVSGGFTAPFVGTALIPSAGKATVVLAANHMVRAALIPAQSSFFIVDLRGS